MKQGIPPVDFGSTNALLNFRGIFVILFSDQAVDKVYCLIPLRKAQRGGEAAGKAVQY